MNIITATGQIINTDWTALAALAPATCALLIGSGAF